jgi:arginyl-tRNA synthetase
MDVIAHNIQQQPFLVPITDRASSHGSGNSDQRQELWSNLTKLSFDEICSHLDSLQIKYDRNSPKDFLVDTLRRYLITDIN